MINISSQKNPSSHAGFDPHLHFDSAASHVELRISPSQELADPHLQTPPNLQSVNVSFAGHDPSRHCPKQNMCSYNLCSIIYSTGSTWPNPIQSG